MKYLIFLVIFFYVNSFNAQEVFITKTKSKANYIIHVTRDKSLADWIIMKTNGEIKLRVENGFLLNGILILNLV